MVEAKQNSLKRQRTAETVRGSWGEANTHVCRPAQWAALRRRPPAPPPVSGPPAHQLLWSPRVRVQARMYNKARKSEVATRMKKVSSLGTVAGHSRRAHDTAGMRSCGDGGHFAAAGQQSCGCRCLAQVLRTSACTPTAARAHRRCSCLMLHRLQVLTALDAFKASPPAAEADLAPVQALINEAYQGENGGQQPIVHLTG